MSAEDEQAVDARKAMVESIIGAKLLCTRRESHRRRLRKEFSSTEFDSWTTSFNAWGNRVKAIEEVMTEAYGQRLGGRFRVESAPAIVTRALRTGNMAVTEVRCDNPLPGMSDSIQLEDAFLVALQLRDVPNHEYWEDGRQAPVGRAPSST
jgi:hypothetical protein